VEPAPGLKRIGVLRADSVFDAWIETFRKTLDAVGYVEGALPAPRAPQEMQSVTVGNSHLP